jgi:hypothetical protein
MGSKDRARLRIAQEWVLGAALRAEISQNILIDGPNFTSSASMNWVPVEKI